ncbi:hypothetical protein [Plastoroseomonas arctica]|uniref:Uncharacterized protein n=1 Tax=Plastoroseomonas arctica TaxID=1509237 RepID=A0AAF1KMM8_9PROT|nr:hypothetical protein [Plastoroseomonas arctica]MBR0653638.1 hypothetical protein [Plastoroseomonas arctica]
MRRLAFLALLLASSAATAQQVSATWVGHYTCPQGNTAVNLTIIEPKPGVLNAWFHFQAPPDNPFVPTGCYTMTGTYDAASRHVRLDPGAWLHQPFGYVMVGLDGEVSPDGTTFEGQIDHPACGDFATSRRAGPSNASPCQDGGPLLSMR